MPVKVRSGGAWVQVAGDGADGQPGADGGGIPTGTIVMYNGSTAPTGWELCDGGGSPARPDLRNKFVIGAGSSYNLNAQGGFADATLVSHSHTISGNTNNPGDHVHNHSRVNVSGDDTQGAPSGNGGQLGETFGNNYTTGGGGSHTHSVSGNTNSQGNTATGKNLPPYWALTYIIKT